jgi:hypothetical protein
MQYLQAVSSRVALGSELLYQFGDAVPGNQMAIYTLAGRYTGTFVRLKLIFELYWLLCMLVICSII